MLLLAGAVCAQDKPQQKTPAAEGAIHRMRAPAPLKAASTCSTTFQPFVTGQIFASISDGQVAVFNPDGTCVQILTIPGFNDGAGFTTGGTFDTNGNFYVTLFSDPNLPNGGVYVFHANGDNNQNGTPFGCSPVLSCYNAHPESIGQAINGNFIVGQADGNQDILEFDSNGNLLMSFHPQTENRGTDWSDLQADQKTVYYTSEGISVLSFDISTNTQNPDFATNLPGSNAYAHRTLPNGNVLVADTDRVVQLDTNGNIVETYMSVFNPPVSLLFGLNLDPDGQDFWTADLFSGQVYELNIATGAQVTTFSANNIDGLGVAGLSIFGETKPGTADLSIVKTGAPNPVNVGSPLVYTLTIGNAGPLDDTNVTVSDTLPAGVTFVSDNPSQGSCSGTTTISCNLGTVKNGAQATVLIGVTPTVAGTLTNTATVTGDNPDPNQTNNTSTIMTTVNQSSGPVLMVTLAGNGTGSVTSSPAGINCPETCSASFPSGTVVMLSEMAGNNSSFGGWSMDCSGTGACSVTMNTNHSVTATFNSNSGNTFNFVPLPGTGTTATVVPGQGANFPLTIGSNNGFTGVVNLTCSISGPPSITCSILPSSVTLTNGTTTATISVKTFCSGAPPAGPSWRLPGVGLWYLAGAALFCGLAFAGRRRGLRLAWASGVLAVALMCAGCPSTPKGPDGRTAPGTYHLTIFATAQGQQVPGGQIQLTLIVQ
jgi:uncharacterized repeat protein (TIGR01451 family)